MLEHNPVERSLKCVDIALEKLVRDKHLQLPLASEDNKYLILSWIDPLFSGVAPNYTLRTFLDRKQRGYTADVCDKVFAGLSGMTEQAYMLHFCDIYWQRDREVIFGFQHDFQELNEGLKEELREVVYRVRERENSSREEYSIMLGVFFLHKAHKLKLVQPHGCFLRYVSVQVDEEMEWGMKA
jgi:hypothetical protein